MFGYKNGKPYDYLYDMYIEDFEDLDIEDLDEEQRKYLENYENEVIEYVKSIVEEEMEKIKLKKVERDILIYSYYLINLFVKDGKEVKQLQIQKLLYLFEAYYMNVKGEEELYNCNFNAWQFGPVAVPICEEYKEFGEDPIKIEEDKIKKGNKIGKKEKRLMKEVYKVFGSCSCDELVDLTCMQGSPWHHKWLKNKQRLVYGYKSYIDKKETRKWFKKWFIEE